MVQTRPEEPTAEQMQKLPTPPEASTPKPAKIIMPSPQQTPRPTFTGKLERVTTPHQFKSPFKTPSTIPSGRFPIIVPTPKSTGLETRWEPKPSSSRWSSKSGVGGTVTPTRPARAVCPLTRSTAKQAPGGPTSFLPKRSILFPTKGSSSKRAKN